MTCIVAHKDGWMVADQRVSFGTYIGPYVVKKILKLDWPKMLIGVAGCGAFLQVLPNRIKECSTEQQVLEVLSDLCRSYKAGGEDMSLIVTCSNKIIELDPSGGMYEVNSRYDFWAVGSGSTGAIGYIDGLKECGVNIDSSVGVRAVEYISKINVGVGDGFQVEKLNHES